MTRPKKNKYIYTVYVCIFIYFKSSHCSLINPNLQISKIKRYIKTCVTGATDHAQRKVLYKTKVSLQCTLLTKRDTTLKKKYINKQVNKQYSRICGQKHPSNLICMRTCSHTVHMHARRPFCKHLSAAIQNNTSNIS